MKKSKTCKGAMEHGTGCGFCGGCMAELARLKRENGLEVNELELYKLDAEAKDPKAKEIIRLARIGLWAERHSVAIDEGLLDQGFNGQQAINSRPGK